MFENENLQESYNKWHSEMYQIGDYQPTVSDINCYNWILDKLDITDAHKKNILDTACGKGFFLKEAKKRGLQVYGIDISNRAIENAQNIVDGVFSTGNVENMDYEDETFDYLTCLGSLEHFPTPSKAISEFSRVMKNEGLALIYVPNLMFLGHIYMAFRYGIMPSEGGQSFSEVFYTYRSWKDLLENNGLIVSKVYSHNYIYGSNKVSKFTSWMWRNILRHFVPFNLSYAFVFICKKKL